VHQKNKRCSKSSRKTKTSRKRKKHKFSCKKARKKKKSESKHKRMLKEIHINISNIQIKRKSKWNTPPPTYQHATKVTQNNKKTKKHAPIKNITLASIITKTPPSSINKKIQQIKNIPIPNKRPINTFHNKKTLLKCGDIESNPGPRPTLLSNHPQIHLEKQKTYFYNKTTQIKPEYSHILEIFKPYLNHTQTININPHLIQFCRNHNHCPKSYIFYAILITLVLHQHNATN
jgi:hypothetical protein